MLILCNKERELLKKKVVIFAPHPDDETFYCGGTIAKKLREGLDIIIVVMTDGRNLFRNVLKINSDPDPDKVKKMRRAEVLRATGIPGVPPRNIVFLDFEDGMLGRYESEAEKMVTKILQNTYPVEVYIPFMRDSHPDHRVTNRIVRRCLKELELKPSIYQYCGLHKFARVGLLFERLISLFMRNLIKVDVSDFISIKEKMIKEYKSEISVISSQQEKPLENNIEKYLKEYETFFLIK